MEIINEQPYFSVIIPTRDRPELFFRTLASVLQQTSDNFEIIVVNDGSGDDNLIVYQERLSKVRKPVSFISLVHTPNGHGPSYSRNFGARAAKGQYLCFLDDDDEWTDSEYLSRVYSEIQGQKDRVDAYYCHQKAYLTNGDQKTETIWIEDLIDDIEQETSSSAELVSVNFMLKSSGFAHMNCSIYRKHFFNDVIQGMNENIRYESDRDLYYRAIDNAVIILFSQHYIAKHYIPDRKNRDNVTTKLQALDKLLFQIQSYNRFILFANHPEISERAKQAKMYALKKIAEGLNEQKEYSKAFVFAKEALSTKFSIKWSVYLVMLKLKQILSTIYR